MVIPDKREWLSVLACTNREGGIFPIFFIFKGRRCKRNYLGKTNEFGATIARQAKVWMTKHIFKAWINYFIKSLSISSTTTKHRHLLILNGQNSHVTLDMVNTATLNGLDIITSSSHTSHADQPLDVTCFKPFKVAYGTYRDKRTLNNKGKVPEKEESIKSNKHYWRISWYGNLSFES